MESDTKLVVISPGFMARKQREAAEADEEEYQKTGGEKQEKAPERDPFGCIRGMLDEIRGLVDDLESKYRRE